MSTSVGRTVISCVVSMEIAKLSQPIGTKIYDYFPANSEGHLVTNNYTIRGTLTRAGARPNGQLATSLAVPTQGDRSHERRHRARYDAWPLGAAGTSLPLGLNQLTGAPLPSQHPAPLRCGIATPSFEAVEDVADERVRVGFFRVGDVQFELLEPSD